MFQKGRWDRKGDAGHKPELKGGSRELKANDQAWTEGVEDFG